MSAPMFNTVLRRAMSHATARIADRGAKILVGSNMNKNLVAMEYAVRGEIPARAETLANELAAKDKSHPFDSVVLCNIGNPQGVGQNPITFFRQVMALTEYPTLLATENRALVLQLFPDDAIRRAEELVAACGSTGAYTGSQGMPLVRKHVAEFIAARDAFEARPDDIFLTNGASSGIKDVLSLLAENPKVGVMVPIPQYPLYSATIAALGISQLGYYLDESNSWGMNKTELERTLLRAADNGVTPRAMCVINPGNPTGQCLSHENMKDVVRFCERYGLVLLADEVYQENIYTAKLPFHSFKKVVREMGSDLELISFHSTSKGFIGECGKRGGYAELTNVGPEFREQFYKLQSVSLCSNISGQVMTSLMVKPPVLGETSHGLYERERTNIVGSLSRRAELLVATFNSLEGVSCNEPTGSMYVFPTITLPQKAMEAAEAEGKAPDVFYCLRLLEATGVCVVPGSGFGQLEGTFHFRCTFLPPEHQFEKFTNDLREFHGKFLDRYA